jgi:twitching motility protein PilT
MLGRLFSKEDLVDVKTLLEFMVKQNISDIHLKADSAPLIRLHGRLITADQEPLTADLIKELAYSLMTEPHAKRFEEEGELDFAYALGKISRFRVNIYRQKNTLALSLRVIPLTIQSFDELNLPAATLGKLCNSPSGLILISGVTGAGKTTTVNAMVDYINATQSYNIISIEDPIEFFHKDKKSSISQREVGNDTKSFATALKYILRQDPDVIVIGEMRDPETIAAAVTAAETGHLVLSTIHTMDALHTIQRIVDSYPSAQQMQIRTAVANILKGVIAQKLVLRADGKGRVPCTEILVATPYIRQVIAEGKISDLGTAITRGHTEGMMTFDQDLLRLTHEGKITPEMAVSESSRPENLTSMLQGISVKN